MRPKIDGGTQGRVGVETESANAPKEISVEKEKNDLKIEDENEIKKKLSCIINLERDWYNAYNKYKDYYTGIKEFAFIHQNNMFALFNAYFGEVGGFIQRNSCDIIQGFIREGMETERIVNLIYKIYWPDPQQIFNNWIDYEAEIFCEQSKQEREKENARRVILQRLCKELKLQEHEVIQLAQQVIIGN